jgi:D-alanyl-D-alanine dipeptidase
MWAMVVNTPLQPYVANPKRGSMHNYGAAVDITIIDENGNELDMGEPTPRFKIVDKKPEELKRLLDNIKVSKQQASNRALLKAAMESAGYFGLSHEWWHFRAFSKEHVRKTYKIIE